MKKVEPDRTGLTDDTIVVVVLNAHGDVSHGEVHFHGLNAEIRPVVVLLLIRDALEVNLAADALVVTPILASTRSLDQQSGKSRANDENSSNSRALDCTHKTPVDLKFARTRIRGISCVNWN